MSWSTFWAFCFHSFQIPGECNCLPSLEYNLLLCLVTHCPHPPRLSLNATSFRRPSRIPSARTDFVQLLTLITPLFAILFLVYLTSYTLYQWHMYRSYCLCLTIKYCMGRAPCHLIQYLTYSWCSICAFMKEWMNNEWMNEFYGDSP